MIARSEVSEIKKRSFLLLKEEEIAAASASESESTARRKHPWPEYEAD
ncbi:hypothetical protein [Ruminococcus albus]|nr:hypothetical protein [Ruminococcus albus]